MTILENFELRQIEAATASGTAAIESASVDMAGRESVVMFTTIVTANSGNYISAIQSDNSDLSSSEALAGTKVVAAANGDVVAVEIVRPTKRYVGLAVVRGAATAVGEIYALTSGAKALPVDNTVSSEIVSEIHVSPAAGSI